MPKAVREHAVLLYRTGGPATIFLSNHQRATTTVHLQSAGKPSPYNCRMIAKGLLLYQANMFTLEEYMKSAPHAIASLKESQVR